MQPLVRHLRNLLVVFHVVAITAMSMPGPVPFTSKLLEGRAARAEMTDWIGRLDSIGVHLSLPEFADLVLTVGNALASGRSRLQAPFQFYGRYTGAAQGWRMFAFIDRTPSALEIDLEEDGRWHPIYRPRSTSLRWRIGMLEQERVRGMMTNYSWRTKATTWPKFAAWVARQAALDFPGATRVRVQMRRQVSPSAEQVLAGEIAPGKAEQVREFAL